jgi:hypothetical protein
MTKTKYYRYLGRNGIITTPVLLDNIEHIPMYALAAAEGKVLTNGEIFVKSIKIFTEDLSNWVEIDDPDTI